ncbi:hypothetical protein BKA82DRAFT_31967 [Pisolithus tinctorius]|uniref:Uncharacterized protein n=1 Tax=Pisolithus tinctorius Marx 270 TaxID=870435 RepID=A0A0C3NR16_PISTI|nr:hypothetical protein BKA82DRAFT_31967 [Pisolithus tinctorius]KIN97758.1 hypothetical protein M404DRAFT_31967 [Pisolithus tinctorius Marx 270]
MRVKAKERKRRKAAEQAWHEEQAWLEAERVVREQAKAERAEREKAEAEKAEREAEEKRAREEEKCKAEAGKSSEARVSGNETGSEVKKVVMDPGCTCCAWAHIVCKFVIDSNKKHVACMQCNQSKGKCQWPGDGKDAEASPKVKADKGKKRKADEEMPEPRPSQKKWVKSKVVEVLEINEPEAGGSGPREAGAKRYSGLENKLEQLIEATGLIANNLASLFELHETMVENSGHIADALKSLLDESYGFSMAVSPSDSGSSELDSDELCEEAKDLAHMRRAGSICFDHLLSSCSSSGKFALTKHMCLQVVLLVPIESGQSDVELAKANSLNS